MPRPSLNDDADDQTEINLSPMIDCIFILLIFFIVTTVFVEETGVDVIKPTSVAEQPLEKNSILIAVTEDNKVVYGGKEIGVSGINARIKPLLAEEPDMPVIIQADRGANAGIFASVHDEVVRAGAQKVSYSTLEN